MVRYDFHNVTPFLCSYQVVRAVKPTVLIGTSTHSRAFDETIVREMVSRADLTRRRCS